ncbi:hypothetical protein GGI15_003228 [Coemansia interrupta]|uniref:Kinesin motor domain-containing protein n=1 Tax=Coemansia interrupta TaxID=1126814 RepID=A0A9W8HFD9_9FUNG|nr:hypothetical protein GGI15_003228 [Coemansia interrupta]
MSSSQIKLQNTEVVVGLVGSQSIARPGDTSKYFTRTANSDAERVYVDGCTADTSSLFSVGNLQNYVKHAVEGGTSALFMSGAGVTRLSDYDRQKFMKSFCRSIGQCMAHFDPDLSMTYAFVGITDGRVVDFHRDRNVSMDKIAHGLGDLQHEVDDWEHTEQMILRGATLPFILSLHFESLRGAPTNGHLCLVDMGLVSWAPAGIARDSANELSGSSGKLQQSVRSFSTLIHLLANDAILSGATVPNNALISLSGEFLYGECKTAFILYLNTDDGANDELGASVDLIKSLRKLRSREIIRSVDRRVLFFYEKAKYYQGEKYRLQDELTDVQEEKEQLEKDLDDIQRDFSEEREALLKEVGHWQTKSKTLEETIETLKAQSEGIEADAQWENAKLVTEKLALKDELRNAEIEMNAAEDAKSKLLDLYENLQTSYGNLDSVYIELLAAYKHLKERFGQLADDNTSQRETVAELESQVKEREQQLASLREEMDRIAAAHKKRTEELEAQHAQETGDLETQLSAANQKAAELSAKVTQLETRTKSLSISQSKETAELQTTVQELSTELEDVQRQSAAESSALASSLRSAEKLIKRLEDERLKLTGRIEELLANNEVQAEMGSKEAQWAREREQLTRQITRLQRMAENAERREAELREESEIQWNAWESEKNRNHEKYLKLKDRFREAVDYAADIQVKLDDEREKSGDSGAEEPNGKPNGKSNGRPVGKPAGKQQRRKAAPKGSVPAPLPIDTDNVAKSVQFDDEDTGMDVDTPVEPAHTITSDEPEPRPAAAAVASGRRASMRSRKSQPDYTEPDVNDNFGLDDLEPVGRTRKAGGRGRAKGASTSASAATTELVALAENDGDSDDSEITFNTSSMQPPPEPAPGPKPRRRAPRSKKSAQELNAELTTQPARKRGGRKPAAPASAPDDSTEDTAVEQPASNTSPKRKRGGRPQAPKFSIPGLSGDAAAVSAMPLPVPVAGAAGSGAGSNALKKKRKLNLSRMRSMLGFNADMSALTAANSSQAVKFTVPKIRSSATAAAESSAAADSGDSD